MPASSLLILIQAEDSIVTSGASTATASVSTIIPQLIVETIAPNTTASISTIIPQLSITEIANATANILAPNIVIQIPQIISDSVASIPNITIDLSVLSLASLADASIVSPYTNVTRGRPYALVTIGL